MSYHVRFHVGILFIKPPRPQAHLTVLLQVIMPSADPLTLCVPSCVYLHNLVGATGMLKALIISMEIA